MISICLNKSHNSTFHKEESSHENRKKLQVMNVGLKFYHILTLY